MSGRIGDSLMAGPAIDGIRRKFPDAHIDLLVHRNTKDLFENFPKICSVDTISNKRAKWRGWVSRSKYDLAVVFNSFEELLPLIKYALRVSSRVAAFETSDVNVNKKLYVAGQRSSVRQHIMQPYINLIKQIGIEQDNLRVIYRPTEYELQWARKNIEDHGIKKESFLVGYKVFSLPSRSWRDWSVNRFFELSQLILQIKPEAKFLLFGGVAEGEKLSELQKMIGSERAFLFVNLSLRQVGAMMSNLNLYVGVDTGLTHMMSSFDVPMGILYHQKDPSEFAKPIGHPFSDVLDYSSSDEFHENDSLSEIPANLVYQRIKKYLH